MLIDFYLCGFISTYRELIAMRSPIVSIKGNKLPAIEDTEPWDGKDGVVSQF